MLENRDASLAAEAPCSIPPSQIIPPRSWSLLEGALLSVGYPLGKGMNCLRGWLSPRDRAIALISCLVITHASPKQTINQSPASFHQGCREQHAPAGMSVASEPKAGSRDAHRDPQAAAAARPQSLQMPNAAGTGE